MARLRKQFSFSECEKDIYDYLENCKNASALVKKLVREHMIVEQLINQGAIDKGSLVVDFHNYNKSDHQTKTNNNVKDLDDNTKENTKNIHTKIDDDTKKELDDTKQKSELDDKDKKNKDLIDGLPF